MGTRSNIVVRESGQQLVRIHVQFDGYPSGVGDQIKSILADGRAVIVNGYSGGQQNPRYFNGMGCLAAYLISRMKTGIGGIYIIGGAKPSFDIEYEYIISPDGDAVHLEVRDMDGEVIYSGLLCDFNGKNVEKIMEESI